MSVCCVCGCYYLDVFYDINFDKLMIVFKVLDFYFVYVNKEWIKK